MNTVCLNRLVTGRAYVAFLRECLQGRTIWRSMFEYAPFQHDRSSVYLLDSNC